MDGLPTNGGKKSDVPPITPTPGPAATEGPKQTVDSWVWILNGLFGLAALAVGTFLIWKFNIPSLLTELCRGNQQMCPHHQVKMEEVCICRGGGDVPALKM